MNPEQEKMESSQNHPKPHILVVEDEVNLAVGMRYTLEHENFQVTLIHDGSQALERILKDGSEFDVIVLDIMLPSVNGYTICSKARENGIWTPIMFLSARTLPEDKARGFDAGANQYLAKPFELEEFIARIRNMVKFRSLREERSAPAHTQESAPEEIRIPEELTIGNAVVNFNTQEVHTGRKTVNLTFLEISLLKYFIQNANRLIPKEELLEKVWKTSTGMNTRAPDQFILRLRKIFEPDPSHPQFFLTYRNAGYRFVPEKSQK